MPAAVLEGAAAPQAVTEGLTATDDGDGIRGPQPLWGRQHVSSTWDGTKMTRVDGTAGPEDRVEWGLGLGLGKREEHVIEHNFR